MNLDKDKDEASEEIKKDESEKDEESKEEVKAAKKDPKIAILEAMDDFQHFKKMLGVKKEPLLPLELQL